MQQTLVGCVFCNAPPSTETGEAQTWGQDERVTHPICVDCAIQTEPDPDERDHYAPDGCGLVVGSVCGGGAVRRLSAGPKVPIGGDTFSPSILVSVLRRDCPRQRSATWTSERATRGT